MSDGSDGFDPDHYESFYDYGGTDRRDPRHVPHNAHSQDPDEEYWPSSTPRTTYNPSHNSSLARRPSRQPENYRHVSYPGREYEPQQHYGQNRAPGYREPYYDPEPREPYPITQTRQPSYQTNASPPRANRGGFLSLHPQPAHPPHLQYQNLLDDRYMVQTPYYYRQGKVFSILWHENQGASQGTLVSAGPEYRGRFGEPIYSTIRRMVVIKVFEQCSWCFAISTYGGRGVSKRGVDESTHAIVYLRGRLPTSSSSERPMIKEPLEVAPDRPDETLDPMSRINFAKIYTVEHNVKVLPIGRITNASMIRFREYATEQLAL
ncbi:hypothetical protein BJY04DRAFT_120958 [Aspergillus karnatakaensis]|uniref:uncharacterized protein n=1 Tax=Aspergillus karnatakaensis TaxID=1810916 RepID=UPI003CCD9B04